MVKSNLIASKGDSGGAVIIPRKDSDGGAIAFGILSGGISGKEIYFTDFYRLPVALQNRY